MNTTTAQRSDPRRGRADRNAAPEPPRISPPVAQIGLDGRASLIDSRTLEPVPVAVGRHPQDAADLPLAGAPRGDVTRPVATLPRNARWAGVLVIGVVGPWLLPVLVVALPITEAAQGGAIALGWTGLAATANWVAGRDRRRRR